MYVQAISAYAPHPNAAKLWMEYLYSDEGQNIWLKGYCNPIRYDDMVKAGTRRPADRWPSCPTRPAPSCRRSTRSPTATDVDHQGLADRRRRRPSSSDSTDDDRSVSDGDRRRRRVERPGAPPARPGRAASAGRWLGLVPFFALRRRCSWSSRPATWSSAASRTRQGSFDAPELRRPARRRRSLNAYRDSIEISLVTADRRRHLRLPAGLRGHPRAACPDPPRRP